MSKRLSPAAVVALKEALCAVCWYKADLRSFLQQRLTNPAVLGSLTGITLFSSWNNTEMAAILNL